MLQLRVIKHVCLALISLHASHHSNKHENFVATQKTYGVEQRVFIMRKSVELFWNVGVHTKIWATPAIPGFVFSAHAHETT